MLGTNDVASLSADEKRVLLARLIMDRAKRSASVHPMSYGQRALWFLYQLAPGSPAYNVTYAGEIKGNLDVRALEGVVEALMERHAILRTTYAVSDGHPVQLVHPRWPFRIAHHGLRPGEPPFDEWLRRESNRPFDLQNALPWRLTLVRRGPDDHILVMGMHHIAVDLWSIDVLFNEVRELYEARHGLAPAPPPCPMRYVDYADWQLEMLASADGERLWGYWREQLAGDVPIIRLPIDRPRRAVQTYRGNIHRFRIDTRLTAGLKELGRSAGATPYMTLLAAYVTLLHRYSGQDDLFIGSPFACREQAGMAGLVGYVANPLVLRADLRGDPTFTSLLERVKDTVLGALAHQDYPFALLVERLRPLRDLAHAPLFQVSFAWVRRFPAFGENSAPDQTALFDIKTLHAAQGGAPADLMMMMGEVDGELFCHLQYNTDLFDDVTIERMAAHFTTLLGGIVDNAHSHLSELPLLLEAELKEQAAWNQTDISYDAPAGVHEMVATTARRSSNTVAVWCDQREMTYGELDSRADGLADRLRRLGVGPDIIVPILLDRSERLVVAALAVLKAGGALMPLDPAQPANRIAAMLGGAGDVPVCVTEQQHLESLSSFTGRRLSLDEPLPALPISTASDPVVVTAGTLASSLAYVIHTSGSTGAPKGVLNTHGGLRNRLLWMQETHRLTSDDRVFYKTPVTFDAFVQEIFWPLIAGARIVIAEPEGHKDAAYLVRTIVEQSVTTAFFVPSLLRAFLAAPEVGSCVALRTVLSAGEVLPYELAQRFLGTLDSALWNEYGPAETAVGVTYFECKRGMFGAPVPIGRPIANARIHLLDARLRPVPVGVPAELFIGGAVVGRGYLNEPDMTASSFIPDPFALHSGQSLFRTGDLARYLPDGNIEYLGRLDNQVKIRGVRIELSDVEAALERHPGIRQTAVVTRIDDRGNTLLVAHVAVAAGETALTTGSLRRFLLEHLPAAMVPAVFRITDTLPLTSSGKVDRQALSGEALIVQAPAFVAPRTRAEEILAEIWCDVLDLERVGVLDDFFALGGSSTHSLEVSVRAKAAGLSLTPESIFTCGTIAELAAEHGHAVDERTSTGGTPEPETGPQVVGHGLPVGTALSQETAPVPDSPAAITDMPQRHMNTVIESLGTYLPVEALSTDEVLAGCSSEIGIPLERLTGIKRRRVVGRGEYAIDLARHAARDCLARSSYRPDEIDLIIACNISRADGRRQFTFEPSTAARLRDQCGFTNAIAFDISNACAGMFTGIAIADSFLHTGLARRAMVVSGEYISHLTDTAQKEIEGPMDPRLACLTLGDSGAAVILELSSNSRVGFHDLDMATLGRYSNQCIAKMSDRPDSGAIMTVDSIENVVGVIRRAVPYAAEVMRRNGWRPEHCDHVIMHQTSQTTLNDAVAAVNRTFGPLLMHPGNVINNLAERGNTASTTHFVALADFIQGNRIRSGDNILFGISGSGQTVGAALYTFDDLPDKLRTQATNIRRPGPEISGPPSRQPPTPPRVHVTGVAISNASQATPETSIQLAVRAAAKALDESGLDRAALGLIIHVGVYRDEYLSEPAIATFVAGELGVNDDVVSPNGPKTFAFDLLNGSVGFLNACQVAIQMIGTGKVTHAMIVASEIENNTPESGRPMYGLCETGSALMLSRSGATAGFGQFVFRHHGEYGQALTTYATKRDGEAWLHIDRDPDLEAYYLNCIPAAVDELLTLEGLNPADIDIVFPPHMSAESRKQLAELIDIPIAQFVDIASEDDLFTSSLPYGLDHAWHNKLVRQGDIGLVISAGSGVQVGCATYRF